MFIIKTHSMTDLITNSSSELFVIKTQDHVEVLKAIVENIAIELNKEKYIFDLEELWTNIFEEPYICNFYFNFNEYPHKEDYIKYVINDENIYEEELDVCWKKYHSIKCDKGKEEFYSSKEFKDVMKKHNDFFDKHHNNLINYFTKDLSEEEKYEFINIMVYSAYDYYNGRGSGMIEKGNIFLRSKEDNSVPYELSQAIYKFFHISPMNQNQYLGGI